jgi:hypothetical protein
VPPWLIAGSTCGQIRAKSRPAFLKAFAQSSSNKNKKRGGVVDTQDNLVPVLIPAPAPAPVPEQRGFTTADILWALGIWSVILCLSPVIVFYMLMVA